MNGEVRNARAKVCWDLNYEQLLAPDRSLHLLPCDKCGQPQWVALNVVAVFCDGCSKAHEAGE